MSSTCTPHAILRRAASFSSSPASSGSFDTPRSPSSPLFRVSSSKSASSFGCSVFPSCIHWRSQLEDSESHEMLHFHEDASHVHEHFGDADVLSIDHDEGLNASSFLVRHESLGSFSSDSPESTPGPLSRRTSAPPELSLHASETKLTRLINAFQRCMAQRHSGPESAIQLILRGIELKQPAWELLAACFRGHDICVLDIAPRVRFDSDSKSYVHCRMGRSDICLTPFFSFIS